MAPFPSPASPILQQENVSRTPSAPPDNQYSHQLRDLLLEPCARAQDVDAAHQPALHALHGKCVGAMVRRIIFAR